MTVFRWAKATPYVFLLPGKEVYPGYAHRDSSVSMTPFVIFYQTGIEYDSSR
ncbi:MAG: hypothetical protein JXR41_01400 [Bacteroidales bacterium]|nr:hypothetical protein [Bacteroidales bacterium]MBN2761715.1 hypothetical protein [Bacteroidales bacterium]